MAGSPARTEARRTKTARTLGRVAGKPYLAPGTALDARSWLFLKGHHPQPQEVPGRMAFKGVPIDGTLDAFVAKMEQKGLTRVGEQGSMVMLTGPVGIFSDCLITVLSTPAKDPVYGVVAMLPPSDSWPTLEGQYETLKKQLTGKYGKPTTEGEVFRGVPDASKLSPAQKLDYLTRDECKFVSLYERPEGRVMLTLQHDANLGCFVRLLYSDRTNMEKAQAAASDDL